MTLEEYTDLNRHDTFTYWLEYRTRELGSIRGGDAIKFGIYRHSDKDSKPPTEGRIRGAEYTWHPKYGATEQDAFATVQSRLLQVIDAAGRVDLAALDNVDVCWPFVKWKVAFLYQDRADPGILALYKQGLLAARYKEAFPNVAEARPSQQHAALIDHYSWLGDALDISPEIWLEQQPPPSPGRPSANPRYWLMRLGRDGDLWPACYEDGVASIGYDDYDVGDLRQYGSLEELTQAILPKATRWPQNNRKALWQFCHEMAPGDIVFVSKTLRLVGGHGAVSSEYRYDPRREEHRHLRDVVWRSNFPDGRPVQGKRLGRKTLTEITDPKRIAALRAAVEEPQTPPIQPPVGPEPPTSPRNIVLYGPPGTGKTYATVGRSLAIIDGTEPEDNLSTQDRGRFSELRLRNSAGADRPAEGRIDMVTFHQNYAYEDFVEGIRPELAEPDRRDDDAKAANASPPSELGYELKLGIFRRICEAAETERLTAKAEGREAERFVLIIDEINRGNIPKIFGELITLIEDSRRLGADDETRVILAYSGDEFGVPDNLYIIGTMNTADRSIQQLDTALRRRFTFVEMMPEPEHALIPADVDGVDCREVLRAMNERIALLMDREHQIGHTYLFDVKDLNDLSGRFQNKIFPLLQEYFYDDWKKVRAVLGGNAFVKERKVGEGHAKDLVQDFDLVDEETVIHERLPAGNPAWEEAGEYRKIYESVAAD
ncbi:MAG: AAA family ATPase [Acidobacteriota bacterium]|nr:AAA family ATPase [Acidobacteriota bacterium]MDE3265345.1 AAA family ATPase [Acidobacteriota bacterium]